MLAANRGINLVALVARAKVLTVSAQNGVFQFERSADRGVTREIPINSGDRSILNMLWRRKMRLARGTVHYIDALLAQFFRLGNGSHGCGGVKSPKPGGAAGRL